MALEEITADKLDELVQLPKIVTNPKAKQKVEEKHERMDYDVVAPQAESKFRIYLRQNLTGSDDFSCGIRWLMPSGETLTLSRYNGPSHVHEDIAYECHIHKATEEAIRHGRKPESHAERSNRYRTLGGALHCLLVDFHVSGLTSETDHPELFS